MTNAEEKTAEISQDQPNTLSVGQLLGFFLLLGWLVLSAVAVGIISIFWPVTWSPLATELTAWGLLLVLLLLATIGFAGLAHWRNWTDLRPLSRILVMITLYLAVAVGIRAVTPATAEPYELPLFSEPVLRLMLLTATALVVGTVGLRRTGVPRQELAGALGLGLPPVTGLVAALGLIALVTGGWPLTGSLGDSWVSWLILIRALALSLPEEIFFRGAILGLLIRSFPHRRSLAVLVAGLAYLAFTPSKIVPENEWSNLVLLLTAIPFALLVTELRLWTGSIWAGLLFAWAYWAFPLLFTDPRVDAAIIMEPWQTAAHLGMILGAGGLALLMMAGRRWLAPRWRFSGPVTAGLVLAVVIGLGGMWVALWSALGYPGFHNDGFLIIMEEQADLEGADAIPDLTGRRAFVRDRLLETAAATQPPVMKALEAAGLDYRPFYLINMIRVDGHHRRMEAFADLPGVARVMLNPNVRPYPARVRMGYTSTPDEGGGIGWNISQTQADQVWAQGITGQGIVVGGQDTGYDWQHPALQPAYRGYNPTGQVDHTYNWHDAWADTLEPFDDDQHGTHTMGTVVGDDGQGNQIGMAPGAQWIGCRNMRRGIGNPASYTDCMEFFLAPYPLGGDPFTDGDVTRAPHLINNSWGCPDIEGCDDDVLEPATAALRAAGLMMVVSAGNGGPDCRTVAEPPARYDNVFSVGATSNNGFITGFSSRGPIPNGPEPEGETALLKPDVTAPGLRIRSSLPGGGYGLSDGTSMAGPHVAGLVALLWSANPALIGQIDQTEALIRQTARPMAVEAACSIEEQVPGDASVLDQLEALEVGNACACGGVNGTPNNVYGWGEIDALKAVEAALGGGF